MKLIAFLLLATLPTMADAQVYNTLTGNFGEALYGSYAGGSHPYPSIDVLDRYGSNDTPTMRKQREKRIAAFRTKVADVLAANNGTLTDDAQKYLRHAFVKLRYRNQ